MYNSVPKYDLKTHRGLYVLNWVLNILLGGLDTIQIHHGIFPFSVILEGLPVNQIITACKLLNQKKQKSHEPN